MNAADWRMPYRSMDAHGGPETAGEVAFNWIENVGKRAMRLSTPPPVIECYSGDRDQISIITLYQGTALIACATIFRDEMNFAVLVRWLAETEVDEPRHLDAGEAMAAAAERATPPPSPAIFASETDKDRRDHV